MNLRSQDQRRPRYFLRPPFQAALPATSAQAASLYLRRDGNDHHAEDAPRDSIDCREAADHIARKWEEPHVDHRDTVRSEDTGEWSAHDDGYHQLHCGILSRHRHRERCHGLDQR